MDNFLLCNQREIEVPELRNTIKREIIDALDSTSFTSEDFCVKYGMQGSDQAFSITFQHDSQFTFKVSKQGDGYGIYQTPGELEVSDYKFVDSFSRVLFLVKKWSDEVRSELKASQPLYRELDELRKTIEESIISSFTESEDEFSASEINELRRKFEALEERVSELEQANVITNSQREKLSSNIQQVSEDIEVYPKKTWIKTSVNKLAKTISAIGRSAEGRKLLADGARKLLGLD